MTPDSPFGAPVGKMDVPGKVELKNEFSTIPSRNVEDMLQSDRIQPRQMGTGVLRGTQRVISTDGSYITIGEIPDSDGEFGIAFFSADGDIISKQIAETHYIYDRNTGKNIIQVGKLPDNTYGWAVAKEGYDVEDAF